MREHRRGDRTEEREAVARMKSGDVGGLEVLVRRHQERALRAAHLIVGDSALAEDVVQDAFVRAYEKIGGFDFERPFGPWFMRIVVNGSATAASRGRRRFRKETTLEVEGTDTRHSRDLREPVDRDPGPPELAEREDLRRRVIEAIDVLPPAQRASLVQRYYLGMSEADMARDAGAPPGTVKWRLHAARKKLSEILRPPFLTAETPSAPAGAGDIHPNWEFPDERA